MTFDLSGYDLSSYVQVFDLAAGEWVAIRMKNYPPESVNPFRDGRFHHIGEPAYYAASGIQTARVEVFANPSGVIPETHEVFSFPTGEYHLFNVVRFVEENPEASGLLDPSNPEHGQQLRTVLEGMSCSGVMYPSVRDKGGINASVWPLEGTPLASGTWFQPYSGAR
jgi:hypothetical protein